MADILIYGCVNWATGLIEFADSGYCGCECIFEGCMVTDGGIHDGQIAVTVLTVNCDDTYYACIDWATGYFELLIPEECCHLPPTITLHFSGFSDCGCATPGPGSCSTSGVAASINGNSLQLSHSSGCAYSEEAESGAGGQCSAFGTDDCSGEPSTIHSFSKIRAYNFVCYGGGVTCLLQLWSNTSSNWCNLQFAKLVFAAGESCCKTNEISTYDPLYPYGCNCSPYTCGLSGGFGITIP